MRLLAHLLDVFVGLAIFMTIMLVSCGIGAAGIQAGSTMKSQNLAGTASVIGFGTFFLAVVGYIMFLLLFLSRGRTPGKAICGIRVADKRNGSLPGIGRMLLRETLGKFVSGLFLALGYFWAIFDRDSQAWHDKIAGTVVLTGKGLPQQAEASVIPQPNRSLTRQHEATEVLPETRLSEQDKRPAVLPPQASPIVESSDPIQALPSRTNLAVGPKTAPATEIPRPESPIPNSTFREADQSSVKKGSRSFLTAAVAVFLLALGGATWYLWGVETIVVASPPDARVFLDNQEISRQSFGRYVMPHLARRQHRLKVQREGYADLVQNVDFPLTTFTEWVTVTLTPRISNKPVQNSSPQPVQPLTEQTAVPGAASAPEQPIPVLAGIQCSDESVVRSAQSSTGTTVQFLNSTAERINIYWLDFNGQRRLYKALSPGESYVQSTFVTHSWLAADPQGNCIVIFRAGVNPGHAVVQPSAH